MTVRLKTFTKQSFQSTDSESDKNDSESAKNDGLNAPREGRVLRELMAMYLLR